MLPICFSQIALRLDEIYMLWIASASPDCRSPAFTTYNRPYNPHDPSTKTNVLEPILASLPFVANSGFPEALRFAIH
ncbi:MAG: hypothetical protein WCK15_09305 [Pirellula sp.]